MFEAYLHDDATVFRLQLVGHLSAADIPEVEACWTTASSVRRSLLLDLRHLTGLDDAGKAWVEEKYRCGAQLRERQPRPSGRLQSLLRLVSP